MGVILITIKNFILKKDHTNRICKYYFIKIKRGYKMCSYCPSFSYFETSRSKVKILGKVFNLFFLILINILLFISHPIFFSVILIISSIVIGIMCIKINLSLKKIGCEINKNIFIN